MTILRRVATIGVLAVVLGRSAVASAGDHAPSGLGVDALQGVGFDQRIGEQLPLETPVYADDGREVRLGEYFGKRPVVLALVYTECPMLCSLVLHGLVGSIRALSGTAGEAFDVVVMSFDPKDTPEIARRKKEQTLKRYGRPGSDGGFHFLTAAPASIEAVTRSVGFRYQLDAATGQYAHAAGVVVLMPNGTISRYLYGSEFSPRDLELSFADASQGKTSLANKLLLLCYRYDPQRGTYSWAALRGLRIGGGLTVVLLGGFVVHSLRRERRRRGAAPKEART